jgi:exodeoxyribonuclease-3
MLLISWNVNGIRAALTKGMADFVSRENPDVLCLQETKAREEQVDLPLEFAGYKRYWNSAQKPGYSGTAIFSKTAPLSLEYGIRHEYHNKEGRVITAEYADFSLVTVYTPNSQDELRRLDYRMQWDADFLAYLKLLEVEKNKPVIFCGDLNVSHQEIDLARPRENRRNPGFSDEERQGFSNMLDAGFTDTFRHLYPDKCEAYSWWSYRAGARERNVGWRLDYFLTSHALRDRIAAAEILPHVHGSDHCPVSLRLS